MEVVPYLEEAWANSPNALFQERIEELIHEIQLRNTLNQFENWLKSPHHDLLSGVITIAKHYYPELSTERIEKSIESIRRDTWLELNDNLTALEKIKVLNHILFDVYGFTPDTTNLFSPPNHFINRLISTKRGGPIILSIFYAIIAQQLGLPVECVILPKNFILSYQNRYFEQTTTESKLDSILFYINPFNRGSVFGRPEIDQFLQQHNIPNKPHYYLPSSNLNAIAQLLFNIRYAFQKQDKTREAEDFGKLLKLAESYTRQKPE